MKVVDTIAESGTREEGLGARYEGWELEKRVWTREEVLGAIEEGVEYGNR